MQSGSATTRAVRAIDSQIRLIDEQLYERARDEAPWANSPHVLAQRELQRKFRGTITTAALVEQRKNLEAERADLLAAREDYASESPEAAE